MTDRYSVGTDGMGEATVIDSESDRVIPFGSVDAATRVAAAINDGGLDPADFFAVSAEFAAGLTSADVAVPPEHRR